MEPDRLQKRYRRGDYSNFTRSGRAKRAVPHIIYPEILVIVDHDGYRLHGGDNIQVRNQIPRHLAQYFAQRLYPFDMLDLTQ